MQNNVDFYIKCAIFDAIHRAFEIICAPNNFSWSVLIVRYR